MVKWGKHIGLFILSALVTLVVIDVVFQQSKIITGLHVKVNEKGTYFRSDFHGLHFNEGVGVQYTDSDGLVTYSPGHKESWNLYGDSYIEALQVFQRHHFAQTLSEQRQITIKNLGQSNMNFESMYARYFQIKDQFPAQKHIFFISSDDFDTDDIGESLALPQFDDSNILVKNVQFVYHPTLKRTIEKQFENSSTLMLVKSDLRQVKNGQTQEILFDKFYTENKSVSNLSDLVKPKRVVQLLKALNQEPNVVFVYRGKKVMTERYRNLFKEAHIDIIDLQDAMEASGDYENYYYHKVTKTYGHWNREAHQFISSFLAHEL